MNHRIDKDIERFIVNRAQWSLQGNCSQYYTVNMPPEKLRMLNWTNCQQDTAVGMPNQRCKNVLLYIQNSRRQQLLQLYCDRFPQGRASILKFLMHCSMTRQGRGDSRRSQWLPARFCTCQHRMPWLRQHPVRTTTRAGTPSTLSGQTHWSQGCRYPLDTESPTQPDNTCPPRRPCSSRRLRH